jgi:hypothetical protein
VFDLAFCAIGKGKSAFIVFVLLFPIIIVGYNPWRSIRAYTLPKVFSVA